jgi:hypothetical protein
LLRTEAVLYQSTTSHLDPWDLKQQMSKPERKKPRLSKIAVNVHSTTTKSQLTDTHFHVRKVQNHICFYSETHTMPKDHFPSFPFYGFVSRMRAGSSFSSSRSAGKRPVSSQSATIESSCKQETSKLEGYPSALALCLRRAARSHHLFTLSANDTRIWLKWSQQFDTGLERVFYTA